MFLQKKNPQIKVSQMFHKKKKSSNKSFTNVSQKKKTQIKFSQMFHKKTNPQIKVYVMFHKKK